MYSEKFILSPEEGVSILSTSSLHIVQSVILETDVIKRDVHIILAQVKGARAVEEATFIVKEWGT